MLSFRRLNKELALVHLELANLDVPKSNGQNDKFMSWISKVEQVFACYNLNDQEKFKVVDKCNICMGILDDLGSKFGINLY